MRLPRSVARALPVLLVPLVVWGSRVRLERGARAAGAGLGTALSAVAAAAEEPSAVAAASRGPTGEDPATDVVITEPSEPSALESKGGKRSGAGRMRSIFIGERTIRQLALSGVVPSARPVGRTALRPAGIELSGVSPLGVGVHDGDVLTAVSGRPVQTQDQVVALVIAARARRDKRIAAVFFRGGERCSLVVEMPYDPEPGRP